MRTGLIRRRYGTHVLRLILCALFGHATVGVIGAELIADRSLEQSSEVELADTANNGSGLGSLFYQLQVLQEDLAIVRGLLEEQTYRLDRLTREQNRRYTDIDRRFRELRGLDAATQPHDETDMPPLLPVLDPTGTERGSYESAYTLTNERKFHDAIVAFDQFIVDYPNGQWTPNAFYWLGELHHATDNLEKARQSFVQVVTLYPEHAKVPDALYKLGKVYHELGDTRRARDYLDRVINNHPGTVADLARSYAADYL